MTTRAISFAQAQVNLETAKIPWAELQRFFAKGLAIAVDAELDLVDVAYQFCIDNKTQVEQWLKTKQIGHVTDLQASDWINHDSCVWAVVVKPWVLVQIIDIES